MAKKNNNSNENIGEPQNQLAVLSGDTEEVGIPAGPEDPRPANLRHMSKGGAVVSIAEGAVFHGQDLRPPLVKLIQSSSAAGTPGTFLRLDTEEALEELLVVSLRIQATRTKWSPDGFSRDRVPECGSNDGAISVAEFPDGRRPRFPSQTCSECPFYTAKPWQLPPGTEHCQPGYAVLLMQESTGEVFGMRLHGTAARIARTLGAKSHLRASVLRLWGERISNDRGTWYQLMAEPQRRLSDKEVRVADELFRSYGIDFDQA